MPTVTFRTSRRSLGASVSGSCRSCCKASVLTEWELQLCKADVAADAAGGSSQHMCCLRLPNRHHVRSAMLAQTWWSSWPSLGLKLGFPQVKLGSSGPNAQAGPTAAGRAAQAGQQRARQQQASAAAGRAAGRAAAAQIPPCQCCVKCQSERMCWKIRCCCAGSAASHSYDCVAGLLLAGVWGRSPQENFLGVDESERPR
jgi:hypothetical protein